MKPGIKESASAAGVTLLLSLSLWAGEARVAQANPTERSAAVGIASREPTDPEREAEEAAREAERLRAEQAAERAKMRAELEREQARLRAEVERERARLQAELERTRRAAEEERRKAQREREARAARRPAARLPVVYIREVTPRR